MTTAEILTFLQTVVLFLTGAVVVWYTVETSRLRRVANKQLAVIQQTLALDAAEVRSGAGSGVAASPSLFGSSNPTVEPRLNASANCADANPLPAK